MVNSIFIKNVKSSIQTINTPRPFCLTLSMGNSTEINSELPSALSSLGYPHWAQLCMDKHVKERGMKRFFCKSKLYLPC